MVLRGVYSTIPSSGTLGTRWLGKGHKNTTSINDINNPILQPTRFHDSHNPV